MTKKMRKIAVTMMALTTLMASLGGCTTKPETPSKDQTDTSTEKKAETPKAEEKVEEKVEVTVEKPQKIKFMTNIGMKEEDKSDEWVKEFAKLTDIELDLQNVAGKEYYQKLELSFASGDTPDVFLIGDGKLPIYAGQGALVDLTEWVENSELLKEIDPTVLDSIKIDGKIYGIPFENGGGPITYMRQDWLDQLGLKVPTNYNEFIEALRGFKTIQPDAIPFTSPGLAGESELYLREFYQDASPSFVQKDGKWVDGMTEANMVDALTRMRDAYAEGLIDMEVVTNTTSTCRDKWYAGKVGTFTYWAGNWNVSLEKRVQDTIPTAKVTALPAIEEADYVKRVPAVVSISKLSKNPEAVFKYFVEYMQDGAEGSILFQHGVEGTHYTKAGDVITSLPKPSKPEEVMEKAYVSPVLTVVPVKGRVHEVDPRINASLEILDKDGVQAQIVPVSKTLTRINSDLVALREKTLANIVMGQTTVEEGIANYTKEASNLGIDQVVAELNQ